ncbi:MAG: lasso peptide biosynthesis B2 protein [Gemmatimonadales bacterium]
MKFRTELPLGWRIRAGITALVIPIMLLFVSLDRLTTRLGKPATRPGPPDQRVAAWIDHLLTRLPWPWHHTCLRRSLVLYHLLRRAGRPVELLIGVRRGAAGALAAHAWLTFDGSPYLEHGAEHAAEFATIARFPERSGSG